MSGMGFYRLGIKPAVSKCWIQ